MPKPVLQSLILADHVYEDKLTGKRIIAGVFNRIIRGVRVLRQMGPPMPQVPQQPPVYNPPPQAAAQPHQRPGYAAQTPAPHPPATQPPAPAYTPAPAPPGSQPGFVAPGPATHVPAEQPAIHPEPPTPAPPGSQPGFVPPGPATQQPATPLQGVPPSAAPSHSDLYGQSSQIIQPGQPATPVPPQPGPAPQQPVHHQLGPPGTPLQPGQRVLEIPPTGLQSGSPFAYLSLTEVRGANNFVLELVNLSDESQLFRSDLRVDCPDPLLTVEMTVPLPPISPPQAGIYALQLLHNNEILGSLRIIVEDAVQ